MPEVAPEKVLMITGSLPPIKCGIGIYTKRLLPEIIATGSNIRFTVLSTKGVDTSSVADPVVTLPNWGILKLPAMLKAVRASHADVVHIQYPAVGYGHDIGINLLPYLLRLLRWRIVITLHEYSQSRFIGRLRDFITILPANHIIVSNHQDQQALHRFSKRLTVVPLGVAMKVDETNTAYTPEPLRQHGLDSNRKTLYFFGFPFPNKQLEILIEAVRLLPAYQLMILATKDPEDPYHQQLQMAIDTINVTGKRIAWTGFLDDQATWDALAPGSYFVLPQSAPLSPKSSTALTAAVRGQVVIAAAGGDSTPFVSEENCILLSSMSAQSIADAVIRLDQDTALRTKIITGTIRLRQYFSWSAITQQHLDIYRRVRS